MNGTTITNRLFGLMGGLLLLGGACDSADAIDRRFELDPQMLDRKIPTVSTVKERQPLKKVVPMSAKPAPLPATVANSARPLSANTPGSTPPLMSLYKTQVAKGNPGIETVRSVWDQLVPAVAGEAPLEIKEDNFSLVLDPERYRMFPAADGGRIIIDAERSLPPLVKSLIQEKLPDVRVISESPATGRRFYVTLLQAAGFYSVEPDFIAEFGDDPRLSVRADYRIEKTSESLVNGEAVLLFTVPGRYALPGTLQKFLGRGGFRVVEPDLPQHDIPPARHRYVHVPSGSQFQVADSVLAALTIDTEIGKPILFTGWSQQGISLSVRADRSFEYKGRRYVLSVFDGNPVNYTLTRLLETQGVTVVVLGRDDDFSTVTRKILGALKLPVAYDSHRLWPLRETPYSVQVTGFLLRDPATDRSLFLTDRELDPTFSDLVTRNGYAISGQ